MIVSAIGIGPVKFQTSHEKGFEIRTKTSYQFQGVAIQQKAHDDTKEIKEEMDIEQKIQEIWDQKEITDKFLKEMNGKIQKHKEHGEVRKTKKIKNTKNPIH